MKATLLLSAALLLVTKSGEAAVNIHSDGKPPLGQFAFHRAGKNTVRSGAKTQKPGNSESDVRSVAASPTSENNTRREEMPGDRPSDSAWEGRSRRLAAGRSHAQPKSPGRTAVVQGDRASGAPLKDSRGAPNLLLSFAGKSRLLVISAPHHSDGYYRLMVSLLKPEVYCQLAERHVHQIVMFHQDGETAGEVRYISSRGQVVEEPLEAPLIPRLMNFLRLEKGKFGMVLLRKTLQVEQRYPYPVRLEAIFEVIDGAPARRFEKVRQEGFMQKCKGAGVEGQVVEGQVVEGQVVDGQVVEGQVVEGKDVRKPVPGPDRTTWAQTTTTSTTTITVTSKTQTASTASINPAGTAQSSTTATWSTRTRPSFMTVNPASTTQAQTISQWIVPTKTSSEPYHYPPTRDPQGSRYYLRTTPNPTSPNDYYSKGYTSRYLNNITDTKGYNKKYLDVTSAQPNLSHIRLFNKKSEGGVPNGDYEDKSERKRPMGGEPEESQKGKEDVVERRKRKKRRRKEKEKADKTDGLLKMAAKVGKGEDRSKNTGEKVSKSEGEIGFQKPGRKRTLPKGSLSSFLGYFDGKRRLILITTPCEDHPLYVQQRDGFLEHVCEMALRKVSIITILGNLTNGTMKIDHYQLEHDEPMRGLRRDDLVNQDLIIELRKGFGMTYDHFYMGLTDFDLKVKQYYQVPIVMKAVLDYIDMFSSRIQEMEQQKRDRLTCKKEDNPRSLENFLSRFRWRRRLFIISTPADEDWTYQLQLHALSSQACHLGLRHVSVLKLVGVDAEMGGVVELYPINGSATIEREGISASLVKDIRNYFQVSPEYFSMLLVGKDGNVKSWYPSPMWSMAIVYDLVDSMQLRRQEMAIQQSLGMRCPEDEYGGYDDPHRGYHHGYQDGYDPVRDGR